MTVPIIAHRTARRHAPENSLEGIRKAAELLADAVEVDVQRTLDGVPILMHDRFLWRTTRCPLPARVLPWALLRRLRLRRSASERVPTVAEALAALPPGLAIAIEMKHASATPRTLAEVEALGLQARTMLWSEKREAVRFAAARYPDIEASLLDPVRSPDGMRRFLDEALSLGARGVSAHWRGISEEFTAEAHERGLKVYSLSPDVESTVANVRRGLDGAITPWPLEVRRALESTTA